MSEQIKWIRENYPMAYDNAVKASKSNNKQLFFDTRYWSAADIKEFFEDLEYANHEVWELLHKKLSSNCHNRKAEKRYNKWRTE